jgi:hypothetical protein
MSKDPTTIDGALLPDMVYREALRRIEALMGCTDGSLEEAELIHWSTVADNYERATGMMEKEPLGPVPGAVAA